MIDIKNKFLFFLVNSVLFIFQILQVITGLIGLAIFHNFEIYTNKDAHIKVIKINKGNFLGGACFSSGPFIFVVPNCEEEILKHETGHSVQSIILGPLFHIVISTPSVILFWRRRLGNKSKAWYYKHFPENWANSLGHVDTSKYDIE